MISVNLLPDKPYGLIYYAFCIKSGKGYIGQTTKTVTARWSAHVNEAGRKRGVGDAILKYGPSAFVVRVVGWSWNPSDLDNLEITWVQRLNTQVPNGYNLTQGGRSGGKPSQETRQKMSASRRGKIQSLETRQKRIATLRGLTPSSTATPTGIRTWKQTDESNRKRSEAMRAHYVKVNAAGGISDDLREKRRHAGRMSHLLHPEIAENLTASAKRRAGKPGPPCSDAAKEKNRIWHTGRKQSPETIEKRGLAKASKGRS